MPRKPMTEEQKERARANLAAARAKKAGAEPVEEAKEAPVATTVAPPAEWIVAQEGLRWVKDDAGEVYGRSERNSFLEASGYDNNFEKRAISSFQRCLRGCLRADGTPNMDLVPEFSNELQFEVSFRFVPKR